jgi:hypothetical protein
MVVVAVRNTNPDAMISAYKIVHAMGKTQLGGDNGDWLRDLYQAEDAEASGEADAAEFIVY